MKVFSVLNKRSPSLLLVLIILSAGPAAADCTNPVGKEADIKYNGDYHTYQFCNGTSWIAYGGGLSCSGSSGYSPTTPSGSGYFVLSHDTYDGNLGGITGADAKCLADLTTNTGWLGYSTANSNGQLVADKVHAFLCGPYTYMCNNLMPLTTYYFANAANSSAGGGSFTTDTDGLGPNDLANWAAGNYFNGYYTYWTGRGYDTDTRFSNNSAGWFGQCSEFWDSNSSSDQGQVGNSTRMNAGRWITDIHPVRWSCDNFMHLICFVNP